MTSAASRFRAGFETLLELIVIVLMVALALEVTVGVVYRKLGMSLVWYDEIASVLLAWLTFYGSALAALKRAHIGFPGLVNSFPPFWRVIALVFAEALVIGFFALLGWVGYSILEVLATDYLVSLPEISVKYTQSVIPISSALIIAAQLVSFPQALAQARRGDPSHEGLASEASH